ncbi:hypothetical protein H1R20_g947, partial [Candolleomyces eurysporus]
MPRNYAMQMAHSSFSGALFHVGGQNVFCNAFTPNGGSPNTPAYAIYENENPVRVLLFNYISDSSGANDLTVGISIGGGQTGQQNGTPGQVRVKYVIHTLLQLASSVSQKGNFTWVAQVLETFGANFESDGRLRGQENIEIVSCDQSNNVCNIRVPAPGVALVFLTGDALSEVERGATTTFP